MKHRNLLCFALLALAVACGSGEDENNTNTKTNNDTSDMASNTTTMDMGGGDDMAADMPAEEDMPGEEDMPADEDMAGDMAADMPGDEDMGADMADMGSEPITPPTNGTDIFPWLQDATNYNTWPAESAVHDSSGPHGKVRTFINPTLDTSLGANNAAHPEGSTSVKELYEADGTTLQGWAVMVKTQGSSDAGDGWYWYEIFSTTDDSNPVADGNGIGTCTNCHGSNSKDFFKTPYPLQ